MAQSTSNAEFCCFMESGDRSLACQTDGMVYSFGAQNRVDYTILVRSLCLSDMSR